VAEWLETYRGVVNPWECDLVQHFTIAYYFDRFADATRNFFDLTGAGDGLGAGVLNGPSRGHATFQHELRAGAGFHILTAVSGIDASALRLGHQVVDSTTGKTVAWLTETRAFEGLAVCNEPAVGCAICSMAGTEGTGPPRAKGSSGAADRSRSGEALGNR
jgi:acyl-CoA thioesterase FadM